MEWYDAIYVLQVLLESIWLCLSVCLSTHLCALVRWLSVKILQMSTIYTAPSKQSFYLWNEDDNDYVDKNDNNEGTNDDDDDGTRTRKAIRQQAIEIWY